MSRWHYCWIDSEINFILEHEGWFERITRRKIYEEQAFSQLKHTTSPFFFLFSPHTLSLSLSSYLLYLAAQREKLSAAENSFLAAAASRELISVLDRREFFQVLKVFSLLSPLIFFKREKAKRQMWNVIVRYEALSFQWRNQCGVNKIITIQSVESARVQLNQRLCCNFTNYDIT